MSYFLATLGEIGFSSPKVQSYSRFNDDNVDYGVVVMTKLNGKQVRSFSPEVRSVAVSTLLDELQKLKICRSDGGAGDIKHVRNGSRLTWKSYLGQVIDEAEVILASGASAGLAALVDWGSILSAIGSVRAGIARLPGNLELNLLHNDLNLANCIAEDGQLIGIIDWNDAIYGDWLYDIARLKMNLEQSGDNPDFCFLVRAFDFSQQFL